MLDRTSSKAASCDTLMPSGIRGLYDALLDRPPAVRSRPQTHIGLLAIEQLRGRPPFEDMDPATLSAVLPHLSYAIELRRRLEAAEDRAGHAWQAVALLGGAVIIVDGGLRPVFANGEAKRLVDAADGLSIRRGRLCASAAESDGPLRRAVEAAIGPAATDAEAKPTGAAAAMRVTIRRPSGRPVLLADVMRLDPGGVNRLCAPPARAAVIVSACEPADIDAAAVAQLFRLSPRQAALAAALVRGASLAQAAVELGVTRETARSSLKLIFEKTGTRRQVDLIRLILQAAGRPARPGDAGL